MNIVLINLTLTLPSCFGSDGIDIGNLSFMAYVDFQVDTYNNMNDAQLSLGEKHSRLP